MNYRKIKLALGCLLIVSTDLQAQVSSKRDTRPYDVRNSVVRVMAAQQFPQLTKPWLKQDPQSGLGSGVVIKRNRILTCAHLVIHATQIHVQPFNTAKHFSAKVVAMGPDMDFAILEIDDPQFFKIRRPLPLSDSLPEVNDPIELYGYPVGGAALRPAKGVVSRIEYANFAYGESGLRIEVNSVISPGNSGGPALSDGKVIGLVYASAIEGRNIGYLVATEEIHTFLTDVEDGKYDGKPAIWLDIQGLSNRSLRAKLGVLEEETGVLVRSNHPKDPDYAFKQGDIVTMIGNYPIDNDGMVSLPQDSLRVSFEYLVPKLARNGKVPFTVLRRGRPSAVQVPVIPKNALLVRHLKGESPPYFVWGPMVFSPASGELVDGLAPYLAEHWGITGNPLATRRTDFRVTKDEELVMVTSVFPHESLEGYSNPTAQVVSQVNGTPIRNLRHFVETLRTANQEAAEFIEFRFSGKFIDRMVFSRKNTASATAQIMANNGVPRQGSADMLQLWKA